MNFLFVSDRTARAKDSLEPWLLGPFDLDKQLKQIIRPRKAVVVTIVKTRIENNCSVEINRLLEMWLVAK